MALTDLHAPFFCLETETDQVSPWQSVLKLQLLTDNEVTFCLKAGGHNGGVLSKPGHKNRHVRLNKKIEGDPHIFADTWMEAAEVTEGSWWPAWVEWLSVNSGAMRPVERKKRWKIGPAPGKHVFG